MAFSGNWYIPPSFHGNFWAPGGDGVHKAFVFEPLFLYLPKTRTYLPRLGLSFDLSADRLCEVPPVQNRCPQRLDRPPSFVKRGSRALHGLLEHRPRLIGVAPPSMPMGFCTVC